MKLKPTGSTNHPVKLIQVSTLVFRINRGYYLEHFKVFNENTYRFTQRITYDFFDSKVVIYYFHSGEYRMEY